MAGSDDKTKSDDLDLDIKKTGATIGTDQAGELAEGDLDQVAGGQLPRPVGDSVHFCHTDECPTTLLGC